MFQVQSELTSVWVTPAAFRLVILCYCMRATSAGGLGPGVRLPAVFETRDFLLCVVTSSQRKQPWMKQVDSTFPQIRPPNQDPHNRTCVRKQSKRSVNWSGCLESMSQMFQSVRRVQFCSRSLLYPRLDAEKKINQPVSPNKPSSFCKADQL